MSLHAIDDIGDAIDATKAFLTPVSVWQWFKLAVVVFFIGGGGGGGFNQYRNLLNADQQGISTGPEGEFALAGPLRGLADVAVGQTGLPPEARAALAGVGLAVIVLAAALVVLFLFYGFLSNFMEFVFVESLIEREVHVRRYFGANAGNGLRLFAFRLAVKTLTFVAVVLFLYGLFLFVLGINFADPTTIDRQTLLDTAPLFIVPLFLRAIVVGLITGFTNNFVVPLMIAGDHGVLPGWRRLWSSITDHPKQYGAYVFFSVVLGIGANLIVTMFILFLTLILLIPFGIVAFICWVGLGEGVLSLALVGLLGVVFFLVLVVVGLFLRVPLQSFLRYYAMLVLGDVDETLDPIPDVRRAVRPEDSDAPSDAV